MAASKKPAKAKSKIKFKDIKSKKNPKGGTTVKLADAYLKWKFT